MCTTTHTHKHRYTCKHTLVNRILLYIQSNTSNMCELLLFVCFLSVLFFLNCSKLSVLTWFFSFITLSQKWRVFLDAKFDLGRQIALRNRVSRLSVWVREQRTKNINMKRNVNVWPRDRLRRFSFQVDGREDVLLCYVFFTFTVFF